MVTVDSAVRCVLMMQISPNMMDILGNELSITWTSHLLGVISYTERGVKQRCAPSWTEPGTLAHSPQTVDLHSPCVTRHIDLHVVSQLTAPFRQPSFTPAQEHTGYSLSDTHFQSKL